MSYVSREIYTMYNAVAPFVLLSVVIVTLPRWAICQLTGAFRRSWKQRETD